MAKGQAVVTAAVSGGRRALLLLLPLRSRGARGAASSDCRAPPFPVHRCLGDWQRLVVSGSAGRGRHVGGTRGESRCGERGFTTQQSEVIVSALVKIMNTNLDMIYKDMVTKVQQEIALQQVMSHIGGVKKDMIILEKSEFSALRSENEKIKLELQQIKKEVMDEITKVRADNKLNLNLEKTRVKELYSRNERKLLEMRTEIVELHAQQDRALTQTDRKIDTEVADLKTMLETHKLDNIKYLAGSVFTCLTVALGFYRLWG
ncbi:mitochondrial calcium uniporter regulator 1 isoform X2 [Pezoporus occidentalis]|uniref:mitochondrial calcium uniporter regulator 1 isoform X2 n=1 Tax=Pezoporus occidentalis TaxID=407982 RepID=UPI002F907273